jgi:hypothetical protein
MFEYLRDAMRKACSSERKAQLARRRTVRRFKRDFCVAFIAVVGVRYEQMRAQQSENTTTALIRVDALVKAHVEKNFKTETVTTALDGRKNWAAIAAGRKHGHQVSLATNVVGQSEVVRGQLAGVEST